MRKANATVLLGTVLLCACSDGTATSPLPQHTSESNATAPSVGYGWTRPVTKGAFSEASTRLGAAESTLEGHSLHAIVADASVRVRGDDKSCVTCHAWAPAVSRASFCERVPAFLREPTSTGAATDAVSAKPLVLKDLLERWHAAGCPE